MTPSLELITASGNGRKGTSVMPTDATCSSLELRQSRKSTTKRTVSGREPIADAGFSYPIAVPGRYVVAPGEPIVESSIPDRRAVATSGRQKATMLSKYSACVGISTSCTHPLPQLPCGFDPGAGPILVARFEILIPVELSIALNKSEALWVAVLEAAGLHLGRADERAPEMLIAPVPGCEPVRVVDRRPEVHGSIAVVRILQEHAGQRCESDL